MNMTKGTIWCVDLKADVHSYRETANLWNKVQKRIRYTGRAQIYVTYSIFHLSTTWDHEKRTYVDLVKADDRRGRVEKDEYQHAAAWHMHNLLWVEDETQAEALAHHIEKIWREVCEEENKYCGKKYTWVKPCSNTGKLAYVLLQEVYQTTKAWGFGRKSRQDRQDFYRRAKALLKTEDYTRDSFATWQDNLERGWLDYSGGDLLYKMFVVGAKGRSMQERAKQTKRLKEITAKRGYFPDMLNLECFTRICELVRDRLVPRGLDGFLEHAMKPKKRAD